MLTIDKATAGVSSAQCTCPAGKGLLVAVSTLLRCVLLLNTLLKCVKLFWNKEKMLVL